MSYVFMMKAEGGDNYLVTKLSRDKDTKCNLIQIKMDT
jgi:hypothetical protein